MQICHSHTFSVDEWSALYAMTKKQSLIGICYVGTHKLVDFDAED